MLPLNDKKIVYLFTPGPMGGAEKVVISGIKALTNIGINVEIWIIKEVRVPHVTDAFIAALNLENLTGRVFLCRSVLDLSLLKKLNVEIQKTKPDIIHAHGFKSAFYSGLIYNHKFHYIITHHGKTSHTLKVRLYEYVELLMMKKANRVIAVSQDMKKMLIINGIKENKIDVIENLMTFPTVVIENKSDKKIKLLFVGRLSPEKGCSILIKALKNTSSNNFDVTIVGDGIERQSLEKMSQGLSVQFVGFKKNIPEIMAQHDALVIPSYCEGQPLTLIEACCLGLPVIASRVGGIPELVTENENGLLFNAGDVIALEKALGNFLIFKDKLTQNASILKTMYTNRFSSDTWAQNTVFFYKKVLSQL